MSCELASNTVHGYFDGELDAVRAAEFERHLEGCGQCQSTLERLQALRTQLRDNDLYQPASLRLRQQVRAQLGLHREGVGERSLPRRRFLFPAFAVLATAAVLAIAFLVVGAREERTHLTAELVDAHVRSLQPGHLTDVQSTDQHTVKPWFDGKLDFIPPVADYSQQGFPLLGGRLDVLDGRRVAALVYGRRKHLINVFAWPTRTGGSLQSGSGSRDGYNWIAWSSEGMQFCAVSDASLPELTQLKTLIHR